MFLDEMLEAGRFAQEFFENALTDTDEGRNIGLDYFREYGFNDEVIKKFQLGYSPDSPDALAKAAAQKGFSRDALIALSLCYEDPDDELVDRFHGCVMFPIHSFSGRIVAFDGRLLKREENTGKYINSTESDVYHKSGALYGLYFAKAAIRKHNVCYLVKGYTDVISMHQAGVENVVAISEAALTKKQIRLIQCLTSNTVFLYDGDSAWMQASLQSVDLLLEEGMKVEVVILPDGDDTDSLVRRYGLAQFADFINNNKTDFVTFKTNNF